MRRRCAAAWAAPTPHRSTKCSAHDQVPGRVARQAGLRGALVDPVADDVDLPAPAARQAAVDERLLAAAQLGKACDAAGHLFDGGVARCRHVHGAPYSGLMLASRTIAAHLSRSARIYAANSS